MTSVFSRCVISGVLVSEVFVHACSRWQVVGKGVLDSVGVVISINEQEGIATVKFPSCEYRRTSKASDILTVPISRLCTPRSEVLTP